MRQGTKHPRIIGLIALVMLLVCLAAVPVNAQQPCQFKGTVTLDGAWVAAGTPIIANLENGTQVGSTAAYLDAGVSKYNMIVPQVDGVPVEGATLKFYVNGRLAGTGTWNTGGTKTLNLAAVTAAPDILVSPTSLAFGDVTVGTSSSKTLTISNVGNAALTITGITIGGTNANQFSLGTPPVTIAAGSSANVTVTFSPTSTGAKSASLNIASNDPVDPTVSVALSGTGTAVAPDISISPTSLAFGNVTTGTSSPKTLTISNVGNADLTITGINITGTNANQFSVGTPPVTIAAGSSANVTVTFSPTSVGAKSASLNIASNDPDEATVSVALSGTGVAPAVAKTFAAWLYDKFVKCL